MTRRRKCPVSWCGSWFRDGETSYPLIAHVERDHAFEPGAARWLAAAWDDLARRTPCATVSALRMGKGSIGLIVPKPYAKKLGIVVGHRLRLALRGRRIVVALGGPMTEAQRCVFVFTNGDVCGTRRESHPVGRGAAKHKFRPPPKRRRR